MLSTQEGDRPRRRPRPRLESLSDLIYGLSLSIGAISLVLTNAQSSTVSDINRNVLPYLFDQVVSTFNPDSVQEYASVLFTADLAGTLVIMATFAHIIASQEEHLVDGEVMIRFRRARNRMSVLTVVVLLSLAAPWDWLFMGVHVRLFIWYTPIVSFWVFRMTRSPFSYSSGGRQG